MKRIIGIILSALTLTTAFGILFGTVSAADTPSGQIWEGESDLRRNWISEYGSYFYLQNNSGYNDETNFPTSERPSMDCSGFWKATQNGDQLIIKLDVETSGNKKFYMQVLRSVDFGIFDVYWDDTLICDDLDLYCAKAERRFYEIDMGTHYVTPGTHTLTFKNVGKNELATGYVFLIDYFELVGDDGVRRTQKINERSEDYGVVSYPKYNVIRYEGEAMTLTADTKALISEKSYQIQIYGQNAAILSYNKHLYWNGVIPGDRMAFELPIDQDGNYRITVCGMAGKNYGMVQWYIDDIAIGDEMDLYSADYQCKSSAVSVTLKAGIHEISMVSTGTNIKSTGYALSFDYVEVKKLIDEIDSSDVTSDTTATPVETTTPAPADTTTAKPADTTTAAPVDTTTAKPADTTTAAPIDTTTAAPIVTTTPAPADTTTTTPADTTAAKPDDTTTAANSNKSGCGGFIGLGAIAALIPAAVFTGKKKD